jgi:hypothetical protein
MRDDGHPSAEPFDDIRLGRAIGVINPPATERQSHYLHVRPAEQFDAMIHVETTRALKPPELTSECIAGRFPRHIPPASEHRAPAPRRQRSTVRNSGVAQARRRVSPGAP